MSKPEWGHWLLHKLPGRRKPKPKPMFVLDEDYEPYNEDDDSGYGPGSYYDHTMSKDD